MEEATFILCLLFNTLFSIVLMLGFLLGGYNNEIIFSKSTSIWRILIFLLLSLLNLYFWLYLSLWSPIDWLFKLEMKG